MLIRDLLGVVKSKGLSWLLFRIAYEIKRKTGFLKLKFPTGPLSDGYVLGKINDSSLSSAEDIARNVRAQRRHFFINQDTLDVVASFYGECLATEDKEAIIQIADDAISGDILCFSKWKASYGKPINWHYNPPTGYAWDANKHWVVLEERSKTAGDVKYVWEASRFPQFYYFARAYVLTKNEKYAKAYWAQVESWIESNPYNLGINWKCGQEVAFRMFAWLFGLYVFMDCECSTDQRIFMLVKSLFMSAIRIEKNISFAIRAVQNNHAISEAAGIFTFGTLFPFFKCSQRLQKKGIKVLEQEGLKQIAPDGSYIQDSMNYHRLMLQDYTWCYCLASANKISFSEALTKRIKRAVDLLYHLQDEPTGQVPNLGANDGALVFPLSSCDYLNYSPQLNAAYFTFFGEKRYPAGKHYEEALWFGEGRLFNEISLHVSPRELISAGSAGYYSFRGENDFAMIKCGVSKKKSGHADMMHYDFWYKGVNVLCDVGSYSYNPENLFRGYFGKAENHNTVSVNKKNQKRKVSIGPRAVTVDWVNGYKKQYFMRNGQIYFAGYMETCTYYHERDIEYGKEKWVIRDTVHRKRGSQLDLKVNWNVGTNIEQLEDNLFRLFISQGENLIMKITSNTEGHTDFYCGDRVIPSGWRSLYYGHVEPMNQLVYSMASKSEKEIITTEIFRERVVT